MPKGSGKMTENNYALDAFLRIPGISESAAGVVDLAVDGGRQYVNMRGDAADVGFLQAVQAVLGQEIPLEANTMSRSGHCVFWLGPDEWLIVSEHDSAQLIAELRAATADLFATFTDISDGLVSLRLEGKHAHDVLAKGCTLDLHGSRFVAGDCAQTSLAKASILIGLPAAGAGFVIIVRRTFVEYIALWLQHAAAEYGFRAISQ